MYGNRVLCVESIMRSLISPYTTAVAAERGTTTHCCRSEWSGMALHNSPHHRFSPVGKGGGEFEGAKTGPGPSYCSYFLLPVPPSLPFLQSWPRHPLSRPVSAISSSFFVSCFWTLNSNNPVLLNLIFVELARHYGTDRNPWRQKINFYEVGIF